MIIRLLVWRLTQNLSNVLLRNDKKFLSALCKKLDVCIKQNTILNPSDSWENIKLAISSFSSNYASNEAKATGEKLNEPSKELEKLI